MFCAKTPEAADDMMEQLKTRTVRKQYVARVMGEFPEYCLLSSVTFECPR